MIIEYNTATGPTVVRKVGDNLYQIDSDGRVNIHGDCTAEDVIRYLGNVLINAFHKLGVNQM